MRSYPLQNELDIQMMRQLIQALASSSAIVDFEETMLLSTVRSRTRLWKENENLAGFAFVDDYNNFRFEIAPHCRAPQIEKEMVDWGLECMRRRNQETGQEDTLDASFRPECQWQIEMLLKHGFEEAPVRSLRYERSLQTEIAEHPVGAGWRLRCVRGEAEVDELAALHRAAFGTENMTVEGRLAIMRSPGYEPDLDLVLEAPNGELAAFCICGFEDKERGIGYTDPVGTHPRYQRQGLGKAIVTAGLKALKERGAKWAALGTSSENIAMRRLAESLGFVVVSESVWFSREVE